MKALEGKRGISLHWGWGWQQVAAREGSWVSWSPCLALGATPHPHMHTCGHVHVCISLTCVCMDTHSPYGQRQMCVNACTCTCLHMHPAHRASLSVCIHSHAHIRARLGLESSEGLALLSAGDPILRAEEQGCQEAAQMGTMCMRSGGQGGLSDPVRARLGQATCWAEESKPMLMGSSGTRAGLLRERLPANPAFHLVICPRKLQTAPELMVLSADQWH